MDYFLKALEYGEDKIILNNTFKCYLNLRDIDNSDIFFNKTKNADENFIEFIFNKAEYLILKNDIDEAKKFLKKIKINLNF